MRPKPRATSVAFRRAVWASLALHAVLACAVGLVFRAVEEPVRPVPGISNVVTDEPQVRISLSEEPIIVVEPPAPQPPEPVAPARPAPPAKPQAAVGEPPRMLPPELAALLRKPQAAPVGGAVTEVAVPPGTVNPPAPDPNVRPAAATTAAPAPAIHGALAPGQTVVYVLDCSGSMGAAGKFDKARAALVATLKQQPPTVRFQVIAYAGTATPLLVTDGTALPATAANVRAAAEKLAALEARGFSDHYGAVRAALAFRPDVILLLTDADDLSAAAIRSVLASARRVVPVCLGQVTADGLKRYRELK